jgi:hypothetical protein
MPRKRMNWEKNKQDQSVRESLKDYRETIKRFGRTTPRSIAYGRKLKAERERIFKIMMEGPRVEKINWVKDTPKSLALAFLKWQDEKNV